jgi:hypothetical protein
LLSFVSRRLVPRAVFRRTQQFEQRVVGKACVAARGFDRSVAEERLEMAFGHAAADRVRREAVLRAFVEGDVGEAGGLESGAPARLERLVRPRRAGTRIRKERVLLEAGCGVDVRLDPGAQSIANRKALRLPSLRAADRLRTLVVAC